VDVSRPQAGLKDELQDYSPIALDMDFKDILLMGVQKEEASFRLYVDLAAMAHDHDSKEMLLAIAEEEAGHKLRFQTVFDFLSRA
jgi:rubrerythrin